MFISWMYTISKNSSMFITGCFYCISKNMFVFPFTKPSTFRNNDTAILCFYISRNSVFILLMISIVISRLRRFGRFLIFQRFLSCVIRFFSISLFSSSYQSVCSRAICFLIFYCYHMLSHVLHP